METGGEEWRSCLGVEVSNLGRVIDRKSGLPFVPLSLSSGYQIVRIDDKAVPVHRLVCIAFHGPQPGPEWTVDHGNRNRLDNRARNLQWATKSEQARNRDGFESSGASKPIELNFGHGWQLEPSIKSACRKYGFTFSCVRDCLRGAQTHHKGVVFRAATTNDAIDGEEWRTLPSGIRVSSIGRFVNQSNGNVCTPVPGKFGYCRFKGQLAHRLVAQAFLKPPEDAEATTVDHKNHNRSDNRVSNLRRATQSQQVENSVQPAVKRRRCREVIGTSIASGSKHQFASVTEAAAKLLLNGAHISECARGLTNRKSAGGFVWEYV